MEINRNLSPDHAVTVWEALQAWLDQDTAGQALLDRFQADPSGATGALAAWLQSHATRMPPQIATYVSGGQVEKLINIAQAGLVLIQHTPSPTPPEHVWLVPYRRNPFFTGREDVLDRLHEHFTRAKTAALTQPPAITGLGGIGKTQIAVEYAYRHKDTYRYILWINVASRETLIEGFLTMAQVFALPVKDEQDQHRVVAAVQHWLATHDQWLLILDNADDAALASEFIPTGDSGHLLLTTREPAWGAGAHSVAVEQMSQTEGVLFLLRRAKLLWPSDAPLSQVSLSDHLTAAAIVGEFDGLPLALDQAGAYIEEKQSSLSAYLKAYTHRRADLLGQRGRTAMGYPASVATTWSLNFEQVEQGDPAAADLLCFLAFLAPDAIPEDLIIKGATELGPHLETLASDETRFDEAVSLLLRFSLIQRSTDLHQLLIHRLVQAIQRAKMTDAQQQEWAERTVRAVNLALPEVADFTVWEQWERYLPHALVCQAHIEAYRFQFAEAARLLYQTASYLHERAQYAQAEPLYQRALRIREQSLGPEHPHVASPLNGLANLYYEQGKYVEAEPLYQRALRIWEQSLGPEHPRTQMVRANYASLLRSKEKNTKRNGWKRVLGLFQR